MIEQIHKSHNAPLPYFTMHCLEQKCAHVCSESSIAGMGHRACAYLDLWDWSITRHVSLSFRIPKQNILTSKYRYAHTWKETLLFGDFSSTVWCDLLLNGILSHEPLARYVKLWVEHASGMPGTFYPPPRVSDPDMHHGTCLTHVPWCIPGSLTSRWRGTRSRHSRRMRNPQFHVSGKRPMKGRLCIMGFRWYVLTRFFIFICGFVISRSVIHSLGISLLRQ